MIIRPIALLLSLVIPICAQSSGDGAFFLGLDQIEEVTDPQRWSTRQFIFRQVAEGKLRFYRVPMTDMLFGSKKAFALPQQLAIEERMVLPIAVSRENAVRRQFLEEVLLNERLALTESDSLFTTGAGGAILALPRVKEMGVALLFSAQSLQCTRVDRRGPGNIKPLPTFYYSLQGATQVCVAHGKGFYPQELDPLVSGHSFRQTGVNLVSIPQFETREYLSAVDLDPEALAFQVEQTDSLVQILQSTQEAYVDALAKHLALIEDSFYVAMPQRPYEKHEDFTQRQQFRAQILKDVLEEERTRAEYVLPLRDLNNRVAMAVAYRNRLQQASTWGEAGIQQALLDLILHGRWFIQFRGILGRNMPKWAADPGPDQLWGGGGHIAYVYPVLRSLNVMARLEGTHYRWHFHKDVSTTSLQHSLGGAGVLGIPIAVGARGKDASSVQGVVVQLVAGGALYARYTRPSGPASGSPRLAPSLVGLGGIHFLFTQLPVSVEFEYSYGTDGFGDLHAGIGLPLPFGGKRRAP